MDPHEVAPLMGLTANGVAALSYRAREGLRAAWLQAHISNAGTSAECQWTMARLGDRARNGLTPREKDRVELHLLDCTKCMVISEEVDEVGSHLAMVMMPLLLGGIAGGALLASLAHPAAAMAAEAIPALPAAVQAVASGAVLTAPVLGGLSLGASTGAGSLVGSLAIIAVLGGGIALGVSAPGSPLAVARPSTSQSANALGAGAQDSATTPTATPGPTPTDPANTLLGGVGSTPGTTVGNTVGGTVDGVGDTVNGVVGGVTGVVNDVTAPVLDPITGGAPAVDATVDLHLAGSGTPGATVSAEVAGAVYTTVVATNGTWSININALPQSTTGADAKISQKASLLGGLLGALGLTKPLSLNVNSLGLHVNLLN
jgi:hypothetical protein